MTISSDNVKAVVYGVSAIAAVLVVYTAYRKVKAAGESLDKLPGTIKDTVVSIAQNAPKLAEQAIQDVKSALGGDYISPDFKMPDGVKELSINSASEKIKQFIRDLKAARGILVQNLPADFIGWHLYDNGTIISPVGEYFQISDVESALPEKQYAIKEMWWKGQGLDPSLNGVSSWDFLAPREQWQS